MSRDQTSQGAAGIHGLSFARIAGIKAGHELCELAGVEYILRRNRHRSLEQPGEETAPRFLKIRVVTKFSPQIPKLEIGPALGFADTREAIAEEQHLVTAKTEARFVCMKEGARRLVEGIVNDRLT